MLAGFRSSSLLAIALAVAVSACPVPGLTQVTHADSGAVKTQDRLPSDPAGAVEQARKRVSSGDLDGAVKELALYVAAHPREIEPARYLADLYYRQSDFVSAERTLLAILTYAPKDRETHNRLGGIYAAQDKVAAAIDEFQKSLPSSGAFERLVELHRRRGDLAAFTERYRLEALARPSDAGAQFNYGKILVALRKPLEGSDYLQRALAIDGRSCQALSELGAAYLDLGQRAKALAVLQRCLYFEPANYAALVNLGIVYIEQGLIAKARDAFEQAARSRPDGPEALVDIGYLEDLQGRWQSAIQYYLKALALDPLSRDAYVNLGYDYDDHRLYQLAEAAFIKGLSISPNDGRLHYLLGVTYAEQGKTKLARGEYEQAKSSDEPDVVTAATRDLLLLLKSS